LRCVGNFKEEGELGNCLPACSRQEDCASYAAFAGGELGVNLGQFTCKFFDTYYSATVSGITGVCGRVLDDELGK